MATLYRVILRLIAALPLIVLHAIGTLIGLLLWWLPTSQRATALTNLALCLPRRTEHERKLLARASLVHFGRALSESPRLWLAPERRVRNMVREVHGLDELQAMLREGKGVIILTPHLGSWEMAGLYISTIHRITSLYKPQKSAADPVMKAGRERFRAELVPSNGAGVRRLLRSLKKGGIVGILPDQDPPWGSGVFAPFFGISAHTPSLISGLAERTGAAVICGYAERLPRGRGYRLQFMAGPSGLGNANREEAATALNKSIEACVKRTPEQYWWAYKRFRRRPPGESRPY